MFVLLVILLFFNYCYCYHLSNAVSHHKSVLLRHKRLLSINMIPTTEVLCDENIWLELVKVIAPATIPTAAAGLLYKFSSDATTAQINSIEKSTKAQVDGIKESTKLQVDRIKESTKAQVDRIEKSTKAQVDGIKESTKAQVDRIEKLIANIEESTKLQVDGIKESTKLKVDSIEKQIATIEKKIESDKQLLK